jgi:hypothetical protein
MFGFRPQLRFHSSALPWGCSSSSSEVGKAYSRVVRLLRITSKDGSSSLAVM